MHNDILIKVKNLSIAFDDVEVLHKINFNVNRGEILGIVGESGSGKSLTSLAIMGLLPPNARVSGEIIMNTETTYHLTNSSQPSIRGKEIGMIFQEPMTSLNPSMRCGQQVMENILQHKTISKSEAKKKVIELFDKVKLPDPEHIFQSYPHSLSGGQKQRVMIAIAIGSEPKLLIADEPTTALDVTVQQSILELLKDLKSELGMSIIFISHDLGVIAELCERVIVMYQGNIVEQNAVNNIFHHPKSDYTRGLIACRPRLDGRLKQLPVVQDFLSNNDIDYTIETPKEREERFTRIYRNSPILEINHLHKYFEIASGIFREKKPSIKAVDDVSFQLYEGETLGLVGESGSGKTTLSRTLLMLQQPTQGEVMFEGRDLAKLSRKQLRKIRKEIQIIFQDPYSSLNPRHTIRDILLAPMRLHGIGSSKKERLNLAIELLGKVDLPATTLNKYPHEFSGGQRQRIGIARALAVQPKIIICDESVSALDVSVQAQVLNLLNNLKEEFGLTYIFISHDLSVVKYMSDRLIVLRNGEIQEYGDADEIYKNPTTLYTRELINAIPKV